MVLLEVMTKYDKYDEIRRSQWKNVKGLNCHKMIDRSRFGWHFLPVFSMLILCSEILVGNIQ